MTAYLADLPVAGRRVVVSGGSAQALVRVTSLLAAGAHVVLVAAEPVHALLDLAERGRLTWHPRRWQPSDLHEAWLVVDCDRDPQLLEEAEARRIWCLAASPAGDTNIGPTRSRPGRVTLVGGGPGDPGLLTVRGLERLREADVVVVDRLAPLESLGGLAPGVEVVDVSKIPRGKSTPQQAINSLLVERALAGRDVVRLKGGDPFVLGRGMEEVVACTDAGVAVDVVPGVSSAVAVPALAGIPVTHRGLAQGFTVVSAHLPPGHPESDVDWAALARTRTTLVVLMGVATLAAVTAALAAGGMSAGTPAACVEDGALPTQRVLRGTLADIAVRAAEANLRAPAVTVIGAVAGLAGLSGPNVSP